MFCAHKYRKAETFEFKNELIKFSDVRMDGFTARDLAKRGIITVSICEHCGKVKHTRTVF